VVKILFIIINVFNDECDEERDIGLFRDEKKNPFFFQWD